MLSAGRFWPEAVRWDPIPCCPAKASRTTDSEAAAEGAGHGAGLGCASAGRRREDSVPRRSGDPRAGRRLTVPAQPRRRGRLESDGLAAARRKGAPSRGAGASRGQRSPQPPAPPSPTVSSTRSAAPPRLWVGAGTLRPRGREWPPVPGSCHGGVSFWPRRPLCCSSRPRFSLSGASSSLFLPLCISGSQPPLHFRSPRPQVPRSPLRPLPLLRRDGYPEPPPHSPPPRPGL